MREKDEPEEADTKEQNCLKQAKLDWFPCPCTPRHPRIDLSVDD